MTIQGHSSHPIGEDLPRQPTPVMGPSTESNPQKSRLPTDNHHQHRWKRERGINCTQEINKQSLSGYAQQD
jgi:hypothetical protein